MKEVFEESNYIIYIVKRSTDTTTWADNFIEFVFLHTAQPLLWVRVHIPLREARINVTALPGLAKCPNGAVSIKRNKHKSIT